ncbi:DUF6713 family protein [Bacteroidota bacterium]
MNFITIVYIINASLLLLHEIESAYEKEWEILKLPGKITTFLLLHVPIIIFLFYGLLEISAGSSAGNIIGIITGVCGLIPFIVHKILVKREDHFNLPVSSAIIYLNVLSGICLTIISVLEII